MNYFKGRKLGKLCEQMIAIGDAMMKMETEEQMEVMSKELEVFHLCEKKREKYFSVIKSQYKEEYLDVVSKLEHLKSRLEYNVQGKELSTLGYEIRKNLPLMCQGNLVSGRYYFTSVELTAMMVFGFISMFY